MSECYRCKKQFDFDKIEPDYFKVIGYKSYIHNCECGHQESRHIPFTKAAKEFWIKMKRDFLGGEL